MTFSVGIDLSLNSPGMTICSGDNFSLETVRMKYLTKIKKAANYQGPVPLDGTLYHDYTSHEERLDKISGWALDCLRGFDPAETRIAIEGYAFAATGSAIFQIAENAGILKWKLWKGGYPFILVEPTALKKYATKRGNATKMMMENQFIKETGINIKEELKQTADNPSSDIIDSYYLCRYVHDQNAR